jgi:hypothetical protein
VNCTLSEINCLGFSLNRKRNLEKIKDTKQARTREFYATKFERLAK